jgi:hypothetical protein
MTTRNKIIAAVVAAVLAAVAAFVSSYSGADPVVPAVETPAVDAVPASTVAVQETTTTDNAAATTSTTVTTAAGTTAATTSTSDQAVQAPVVNTATVTVTPAAH